MRRAHLLRYGLVALVTALPLMVGTSTAAAEIGDGDTVSVAGTVVSTDPTAGTFVANAYVVTDDTGDLAAPPEGTPTTTQVTIMTNSSTFVMVNGQPGTVAGMRANDHFFAQFSGSPTDSIQTLAANPALAVFDTTPNVVYGFVGKVTAVNTTAGTVTVTLADTIPSTLGTPGSAATFAVGPDTLILGSASASVSAHDDGESDGASGLGEPLSDVTVGDTVAGLEIATGDETLAQVEAQPLGLLLDFPAAASSASTALSNALSSLGSSHHTHNKHHKQSKHHSKRNSHRHARRA